MNMYSNNVHVLSIILIWYVNIQGANSCSLEGVMLRLQWGGGGGVTVQYCASADIIYFVHYGLYKHHPVSDSDLQNQVHTLLKVSFFQVLC